MTRSAENDAALIAQVERAIDNGMSVTDAYTAAWLLLPRPLPVRVIPPVKGDR